MQPRRTKPANRPAKKRPRFGVLIGFGSIAFLGLVLLIVSISEPRRRPARTRDEMERADDISKRDVPPSGKTSAKDARDGERRSTLIDDDGKTLWTSPTDGPPLKLSYLPPGVQIVLAIRPESIAGHDEGDKLIGSLGPAEEQAWKQLEEDLPSTHGVQQLIVGFGAASDGEWKATKVVRLTEAQEAADYFASQFPNAVEKTHNGRRYWLHNDRAYFIPGAADKNLIVVAPPDAIAEIIELASEAPPLRRDVERLLEHTDADRDLTIVVTPNSLFAEGRGMFEGEMVRLRQPLFWFLGDELSAVALSLDWGESFFVELIATPTLDTPPERAARILAARVAEVPDKLEAYVVSLEPQPYGRMVVARFPAMVRKLSAYTRSGFDSDHVVLNAYLPAVAGHNLLMGAELTLAESSSGVGTVSEAISRVGGSREEAVSVEEKLRQRTTLRFARDTLDAALAQLSKDIGVAIVIRGPDLQADGITKNQSFGIDIADKPADEVLVEILRLANPDKTATGPNDVKQKLVYVIAKGDDGGEQILVTTRAAAAIRGDALPAVFQVSNP
jgi:hypothetical protein